MHQQILTTSRLLLEPFGDKHLDGLFRLNSDPAVMRYISGKPQSLEETKEMLERVKRHWADHGCGWWAFIEIATNDLIGAGCIQHLARNPANPYEIGWRLRKDKWQHGYASEAAKRMAAFAFGELDSPDLTAVCHPENAASEKVMQRLGMTYRGLEKWYDMDTRTYYMVRADFKNH
jgi:RimJ/RimL family protein N-acetyltransferase